SDLARDEVHVLDTPQWPLVRPEDRHILRNELGRHSRARSGQREVRPEALLVVRDAGPPQFAPYGLSEPPQAGHVAAETGPENREVAPTERPAARETELPQTLAGCDPSRERITHPTDATCRHITKERQRDMPPVPRRKPGGPTRLVQPAHGQGVHHDTEVCDRLLGRIDRDAQPPGGPRCGSHAPQSSHGTQPRNLATEPSHGPRPTEPSYGTQPRVHPLGSLTCQAVSECSRQPGSRPGSHRTAGEGVAVRRSAIPTAE